MGHPSRQVLSKVSSDIQLESTSKHKDNFCNVFLWAKQSRDPFPISDNKASKFFDPYTAIFRVAIMLSSFMELVIFLPDSMMLVEECGLT